MKKSSWLTNGLNVTQVLVMAEDGINNSNFSYIRAVTPLLPRNTDKTKSALPHVVIDTLYKSLSLILSISFSLSSLSLLLIDFINYKVFSIDQPTPDYPPIASRLFADCPNYDGFSIHACFAYSSKIESLYLVAFSLKKKTLRESRKFKISYT